MIGYMIGIIRFEKLEWKMDLLITMIGFMCSVI